MATCPQVCRADAGARASSKTHIRSPITCRWRQLRGTAGTTRSPVCPHHHSLLGCKVYAKPGEFVCRSTAECEKEAIHEVLKATVEMEELWPSEVCLQGPASNRPRAALVRDRCRERRGKSRAFEYGRCGSRRRTTVNHYESVEIRNDDIKTEARVQLRDESIGSLLTGWMVSGIEMARSRSWLYCGTAGTRCHDAKGDGQENKIKALSTNAWPGDGPTCSSDDEPVIGLEQRGRIDLWSYSSTRMGRSE